jgi:hypothetical protein
MHFVKYIISKTFLVLWTLYLQIMNIIKCLNHRWTKKYLHLVSNGCEYISMSSDKDASCNMFKLLLSAFQAWEDSKLGNTNLKLGHDWQWLASDWQIPGRTVLLPVNYGMSYHRESKLALPKQSVSLRRSRWLKTAKTCAPVKEYWRFIKCRNDSMQVMHWSWIHIKFLYFVILLIIISQSAHLLSFHVDIKMRAPFLYSGHNNYEQIDKINLW